MTRWTEFPLRPHGQPWPGLNTRGGRLDPGRGFLEDGSFGAVINEADILEKRRGLVRGMDERFDGPVCGLFRYTDDCGAEFVVVADQEGIKVRTPFSIPEFLGTDSLPFDDFEGDLDTTRWLNSSEYETSMGSLRLIMAAAVSAQDYVTESRLLQWFKESVLSSYFVEIQYDFDNSVSIGQLACVTIKRNGNSYLQADVQLSGSTYRVVVASVLSGVRSTLLERNLGGASLGTGFLRFSYDQSTRTVSIRAIPSGGDIVSASAQIAELVDLDLGQVSSIGLAYQSGTESPAVEILQVSGGSL